MERREIFKVITDINKGDREVNYFLFFGGFSSNIDIIPIPNDNGRSDPQKLSQDAHLKLFGNETVKPKLNFKEELGDEVWFVIDTDNWNESGKIENLRTNCSAQTNWSIAQSNPCFEVWLYFHFHSSKPSEAEIKTCTSFKEYLNNKISGGFNTTKHPLLFQKAIIHSKTNFEKIHNQPKYLSTEVFNLAERILPFIKETIDRLLPETS